MNKFSHILIDKRKFNIRLTHYAHSNKVYLWADFLNCKGARLGGGQSIKEALRYSVKQCERQKDNPKNKYCWMDIRREIKNQFNI